MSWIATNGHTQRGPPSRRMKLAEEQALGRRILSLESIAAEAVGALREAAAVLQGTTKRTQEVEALIRAVEILLERARTTPSLREQATRAAHALHEAERGRWRLAMSAEDVARSEARKHAGPFIDEEDLAQEGRIGLLNAALRWDPERGIRFRIYARWWVRAQLSRAIDHTGRPIRLPTNAADSLRKLREARERRIDAGEETNVESLAAEVGLDPTRAEELLQHGYTVSLESPLERSGGSPRTLASVLRDDRLPPPDQIAASAQQRERLRHAVDRVLTVQQRKVMIRRYGLEDGRFRTLSEVGEEMGLSRERIRQIERLALDRIRRRCEASFSGQRAS